MTEEKVRNHPTVMIKNLFVVAVVLIVFFISVPPSERMRSGIIIAAIAAASVYMVVRWWMRTEITFTESEIIVERSTLFRNKKTIPYSKVASVNIVRDIFDRIFGTTTLSFNVNSGVNAATPEVSIVERTDVAEQIRTFVSSRMFTDTYVPEDDAAHESAATFGAKDVIVHSIFSLPTLTVIYTLALLVYSAVMSFVGQNSGGIIIAVFLLIVGEVVPVVSLILRYYRFKVYRVDDTIHIQHGAIQTYRTSFDVQRINAVRIKQPFFAKLMHKSCLEAEVIGINANSSDTRPVLCLLIDDSKLKDVMSQLVPEFVHDVEIVKQPETAKYPLIFKSAVASVIIAAIMAHPCLYAYMHVGDIAVLPQYAVTILKYLLPVITLAVIAAIWTASHLSMHSKGYHLGEDMFTFVNGIIDIDTVVTQYDRVQLVEVSAGFVARKYGLAKCTISILSSAGGVRIKSGYFKKDDLSKIGDIMLERLSDGRYDYTKTTV